MSKQLALSAAFSVLTMAAYVLFGAGAVGEPMFDDAPVASSPFAVSASALPTPASLLSFLR